MGRCGRMRHHSRAHARGRVRRVEGDDVTSMVTGDNSLVDRDKYLMFVFVPLRDIFLLPTQRSPDIARRDGH